MAFLYMLKDRLKTIRLEKDLTVVQVAEKLEVSYQYIISGNGAKELQTKI